MIKNTPFSRKVDTPFLALSAIALLLSSPLILINFVPAQAQSSISFRTTQPAIGTLCTGPKDGAALTFDAQGTFSDPQHARITSGTFQVTNSGQTMYSGLIRGGSFTNNTNGGFLTIAGQLNHVASPPPTCAVVSDLLDIATSCRTADFNSIDITGSSVDNFGSFLGAVECSSSSQGGGNTASSSMTGTTTQDSDGDGISDSSDRCAHNSNQRCYKESK